MPITIVAEDGTGTNPAANSYVTMAEAIAYAANRGVTLVDGDDLAAMVIKATDYLESKRCEYQGYKTDAAYPLQWPRTGVVLNGVELGSNVIPAELKNAQFQAILAQKAGITLEPNIKAQDYVIRQKLGPIEREFADPTKTGVHAQLTAVDAWLAPLIAECGQGIGGLTTIRV